MITYAEKPHKPEQIRHILNPIIDSWFFSRFKEFSLPQLFGVMEKAYASQPEPLGGIRFHEAVYLRNQGREADSHAALLKARESFLKCPKSQGVDQALAAIEANLKPKSTK